MPQGGRVEGKDRAGQAIRWCFADDVACSVHNSRLTRLLALSVVCLQVGIATTTTNRYHSPLLRTPDCLSYLIT
jgi:hypothetical protein